MLPRLVLRGKPSQSLARGTNKSPLLYTSPFFYNGHYLFMLANYGFKLRHIFLPFVVIGAAFLFLYSIAYWLLALCWQLVNPYSETRLLLPFALSGIIVFLGMRPRINMLHRGQDARWLTLFYMVPCCIIGLASIFLTSFLIQATGTLTSLGSPSDVQNYSPTLFYTLRQGYTYKPGAGLRITETITGKHDNQLLLQAYIASPVLATAADSAAHTASLWLAWSKSIELDATRPKGEIERQYRKFVRDCNSQFRAANLTSYRYLSRITKADDNIRFQMAARRSSFFRDDATPVVLQPHTEPFDQRMYPPLRGAVWTLGIGMI